MFEKAKAFYEKNKPIVTTVVMTAVGAVVGVAAIILVAVLVDEPVVFDPDLQKEHTTVDGEDTVYNAFEDLGTSVG